MKILLGYDYTDFLGYEPCKIRVKCRLILDNRELDSYLKMIRNHFNPLNLNDENVTKRKIIKIKDYHYQLISVDYVFDDEEEKR